MRCRVFFFFLMVSCLLSGTLYSQEVVRPWQQIDLGFNPKELSRLLAQGKAGALERRLMREKLLSPEKAPGIDDYDVTYYDIHWRPRFEDSSITGTVGIYARATVSALSQVTLFLNSNLHIDSVYAASGLLPCNHQGGLLTIYLGQEYAEGEDFDFAVAYSGQPLANDIIFDGLYYTTHRDVPIIENLSEPYGARNWWPCKDVPWDKADSLDVRVTTDTGMVATSNGLLVSDVDHGDGTHTMHWRSRYPITAYLVCLAVSNFVSQTDYYVYSPTDSMPIVNYYLPEHLGDSSVAYDATADAIAIFADMFVEYPFLDEKYGHTMGNVWGMEHQTNTFLIYYLSCQEATVVHELAHHWWGDLVTCRDWHNIWLNEGFGTYCEALYYEALNGGDFLHAYMHSIEYLDGGTLYVYDISDPWVIFDTRSYHKGAWVLHMLRHVVGDSAFFAGMRDYAQTYAYGTAVSEEFQAVMEAHGGMDLDYFFQEWLHGTYYPRYRYSYMFEEDTAGGWYTYLHLRQMQTTDPQFFTMPIDVHLVTDTGEVVMTVFNDHPGQNFALHSDLRPHSLLFDPDHWILRHALWEMYTFHIFTVELAPAHRAEPFCDTIIAHGGYGGYACEVLSGSLPAGWELDPATCIITGVTTDTGAYTFTIGAANILYPDTRHDSMTYTVTPAEPVSARPGDANADFGVNVGDAVFVINYVFRQGPRPPIINWADVNADCQVNVGDAVYLINFVFREGPIPLIGCVGQEHY